MKAAKFFAVIFAVMGFVLMLGSGVICFASLNSPVRILEYPRGAAECYADFQTAVQSGDFAAVEQMLYSQPPLGADAAPDSRYSALVWEAFRSNIRFEYTADPYLQNADLVRDAVLTVPDVTGLMGKLDGRVHSLLAAKAAAVADSSSIYDADGNYRGDVVEQTILEALEQLLQTELTFVNRNVTLTLLQRDGRWWVLPDQTFLQTLTGIGG